MDEIVFEIAHDGESSRLMAFWDDPDGGGITTQGRDMSELQAQIADAVQCHFDIGAMPRRIRFHCVAR